MINALGVLGYGVGGIEAEAVLLGQPLYQPMPRIVGVRLHGELPRGSTATDLVLVVTEMLRSHGVVGAFVEFAGDGLAGLSLADRATISNMSPEFGATSTLFPIDGETLDYLRLTGRPAERLALVERYAKEQGLWREPGAGPEFDEALELDLATVEPSVAGPKRPQDRVRLADLRDSFRAAFPDGLQALDEAGVEARPRPGSRPDDRRAMSTRRAQSRSPRAIRRLSAITSTRMSRPRRPERRTCRRPRAKRAGATGPSRSRSAASRRRSPPAPWRSPRSRPARTPRTRPS
jgi:aconitase A